MNVQTCATVVIPTRFRVTFFFPIVENTTFFHSNSVENVLYLANESHQMEILQQRHLWGDSEKYVYILRWNKLLANTWTSVELLYVKSTEKSPVAVNIHSFNWAMYNAKSTVSSYFFY